jgi:pimeloyl-ACP methyl ester carboxylesterase
MSRFHGRPRHRELVHGRVHLWLEERKRGEGPPLLLLHGLGESGADWDDDVATWPGSVFSLDFSGHGRSGRVAGGAYTCEILVGDADAALAEIGPAAVAGRGLGAYAALLLAGGRPDDVLAALLFPGPGLAGGSAAPDFDRDPRITLDDPAPPASNGLQPERSTDWRVVRCCESDVRPVDYAQEFAVAARRLLLVEDGSERPPWWNATRTAPGVNVLEHASTGQGLLALELAVGEAGSVDPTGTKP